MPSVHVSARVRWTATRRALLRSSVACPRSITFDQFGSSAGLTASPERGSGFPRAASSSWNTDRSCSRFGPHGGDSLVSDSTAPTSSITAPRRMRSTALSLDQFRRRYQPRANLNADPWPNALVALFDDDADVAKWVDPMPSARICQSPNVLRLHHEPPKGPPRSHAPIHRRRLVFPISSNPMKKSPCASSTGRRRGLAGPRPRSVGQRVSGTKPVPRLILTICATRRPPGAPVLLSVVKFGHFSHP